MISPLNSTHVGQVYSLLRLCWDDISAMCLMWETNNAQASQSDWAYARFIFNQSSLSQNRIALYDLTRGDGLKLEVEWNMIDFANNKVLSDKYLSTLKTVYKEVDRIEGRIRGYFNQAESSHDLPQDKGIKNEVDFIFDAIWEIKYVLYPLIQSELIMERGNLFDKVDKNKVLTYFSQLIEKNNPNGKPYMSTIEFKNFMNRAFSLDKNIPAIRLSFNHSGDRKAIAGLFYHYYDGCKRYEGVPSRDKAAREKYIRLLTKNIEGYPFQSTAANFSAGSTCQVWSTWKNLFINEQQ